MRRGPISRHNVVRVADLEIDRLNQQVRRGGKRLELTPKEYSLLEYMATQPGRVFSRTMIVEHVWDQSFEGLTNIVDVYVRHLREKVDAPYPAQADSYRPRRRLFAGGRSGGMKADSIRAVSPDGLVCSAS